MKILKNQIIYQCECCNKRLLSKKGAMIHEEQYCWHPDSPHKKKILEEQLKCKHEHIETQYSYMIGEAVKEPDYDLCLDCGAKI